MARTGIITRIQNIPIAGKLAAIVVVAAIGMGVVAIARVAEIRPGEMAARKTKIRNLVEAVHGVASEYERQVKAGTMSDEQARTAALEMIQEIRYDGSQYFWINDIPAGTALEPIMMIMHPTVADLNGTDISDMKDTDGIYIFRRFVETVRSDGSGFVSYRWPKPGSDTPVPKLSYVTEFAPWGWVIGTGIYIDDVDRIVVGKRNAVMWQTGIFLAVLIGLLIPVVMLITRPIRRLTRTLLELAELQGTGKSTDARQPSGSIDARTDEVGKMLSAAKVLRTTLRAKADLEREHDQLRTRSEAEKRQAAQLLANEVRDAVASVTTRLANSVAAMLAVAADLSATTNHLSGSVRQISERVGDATSAAEAAANEAAGVTVTVAGLTSAADTIGGVIELIRGVAGQTNLLALNATIEAARAGAAGKGFGVVADEVKQLAAQSASATDDIAREVAEIQTTSQGAAGTIDRMGDIVRRLGQTTRDVAMAVDGDGGSGSGGMSVHQAAAATGEVSQRIKVASEDLAAEADRLRAQFDDLIARIMATS
ncbi:MAG: hypothetical protein HKP61_10475 [Dactylosporangium sp.]|nr:cache domain-containing protein [Dactylosporangium sp.]NNJ61354.1 hypothetical protein [Dactylosporangium sp.]